jgi:carboxyl-terminal processing protease
MFTFERANFYRRKNRIGLALLYIILFAAVSCSTKYRNLQSFETVWKTVNEKHYDPIFGGTDWKALHDHYKPKIAAADNESDFYIQTNRMLFELNLSHLLVATQRDLERYVPVLTALGTVGIDVKWMGEEAVITAVRPNSPADKSGLRPGRTVVGIDGKAIKEMVSDEKSILMPPFNRRNRCNILSNYILGHIYGRPNTKVTINYGDELGNNKEVSLIRESRGRAVTVSPVMPPAIIEFESRRLVDDISYIRFNHFAEPVDTKFIAALKEMNDTRGMIIDLRAVPGGFFKVLDTMARHLLAEKVLLYSFKFRDRTLNKVLTPVAEPYTKPVVVLIDERSMSCSELFAGSLQAVNRAVVIGNRSPGYLLGADWKKLLNGGYFMHTILQPLPSDGRIIEDHGVVPDVEINLDRDALFEGRDTQLEAAIGYILENS